MDTRSTDVSGETVRGRSRRRYQSGGEAGAGAGSRWLAGAETGTALRQGFANQRVCRGYSRFGRRSRYPLCDLHVEPTTQWTGGVATPGSRRVIDGSSLPRGNSHSVRAGATSNAAVSRQRDGYLCSSTRTRAFPCPGTYRAWSSASPPTKAIGGSRNPTIRAGRGGCLSGLWSQGPRREARGRRRMPASSQLLVAATPWLHVLRDRAGPMSI